jgi:prepilin-type N-terminal cleavage/methylation domain-containing protein
MRVCRLRQRCDAGRLAGGNGEGFTLVEILIVISIIALLSSLVLVAVTRGRTGAATAIATTQVSSISSALERYYEEEGLFPAMSLKPDPTRNDFPQLYNALLGEPKPRGPGGRSAPYVKVKEDQVAVWSDERQTYVQATRDDVDDVKVEKYILDPWGNPYVYRCNKGKKRETWMKNRDADVYSTGPNNEDDTVTESEKSDDIGNW